jgi:hypothetical protein
MQPAGYAGVCGYLCARPGPVVFRCTQSTRARGRVAASAVLAASLPSADAYPSQQDDRIRPSPVPLVSDWLGLTTDGVATVSRSGSSSGAAGALTENIGDGGCHPAAVE